MTHTTTHTTETTSNEELDPPPPPPRPPAPRPPPRRQVRLPEHTNTALDTYAKTHGLTPSAVIRDALNAYLTDRQSAPVV